MPAPSQKRALQNYRARLTARGVVRFEVLGRESDRALIRQLAKKLAEDGPDGLQLRATVAQVIGGAPPPIGGVLAALRASPLDELDLTRAREEARLVDL